MQFQHISQYPIWGLILLCAKQLQLREENEKKVSEQLDSINSDIKELEIRLKKDIPELDKSLDINNFR